MPLASSARVTLAGSGDEDTARAAQPPTAERNARSLLILLVLHAGSALVMGYFWATLVSNGMNRAVILGGDGASAL